MSANCPWCGEPMAETGCTPKNCAISNPPKRTRRTPEAQRLREAGTRLARELTCNPMSAPTLDFDAAWHQSTMLTQRRSETHKMTRDEMMDYDTDIYRAHLNAQHLAALEGVREATEGMREALEATREYLKYDMSMNPRLLRLRQQIATVLATTERQG